MRSLNQIARTLSGRTRLEERAELASADTYTLIGVATSDSENGSVRIRLTDSVTRAGWDEEGTDIEVPTNGHVREGQRVYVTCFGGSMQEMVVSGAVGEGDELRADVNTALSEAEIAHEAADAAVEDAGLAKQAAQQAAGSAESAATSAANAASSASNAEADARRAEQSATSAQSSASTAATAASNAQTSAGQAASSASAAAQSASDAQGSAATAASAAQQATQDAAEALRQSGLAQTAADTAIEQSGRAETAARQATSHANSALVQLSTVEDVMGVLDWVTAHGTYVKTTDTAIDATKVYYVLGSDNLYHAVAEPDVADISTYYELSIDQALSNFVASHLALTDQGLYVLKDSSSYKTLLSDTGMTVYDPTGNAVATYGESTTFATDRDWTVGSSQAFIFYDASENTLQIGGANVQIGGLAPSELAGSRIWTATADPTTPNYTFARSALTGASGAPRVGDLVVRGYYRYTVSSVASSTVLTGNRTSIRGATGPQGPQGPQGEQGPQGAAGHSPEVTSTKNADGSVTILVDGTATSTVDAGEDGHSPTVTTTKNADGSVTIYVDGTASSTVEAGTDGTSYYTYVRYSKNANGSGMVATPTAETKYIGVYTGTSSSAPAYTSFNWSKYVGDDAAPLTVTATSVDYILSTSGTNPPADSASWQASPLAPTTTQYLWTRTTLTFSDGTTAKSYSVGGKAGEKGSAGPEAYVTITPSNIDWDAGTATLTATLHVDGAKVTPTKYEWAKGDTALSATGNQCGATDLNATYSCTCTWSGGKQRGTIDFAASNSVKLAAEAGWKSDLGSYYTKSEVDVEVGKVSSTVSETQKSLATVGNPNFSPFFSMAPYRTATSYNGGYWQPTGDNWLMGGVTKLSDGWAHVTRGASTRLEVAIPRIESLSAGDKATLMVEWRNVTVTGSPKLYARNYPDNCQFNLNSYETTWNTSSATSGSRLIVMTVNSTATGDKTWNAAIDLGMSNGSGVSFDGDLRISLYEGTYTGPYKPYVDQSLIERVSTAETTIEQTANNVLIKATESDTTAAQGGQHLIQSLINVAPEGVKIAADKVNIEGAAIFTSGRLSSTSLNNAYDAKGAASTAETNAKAYTDSVEIGGRNLLQGSDRAFGNGSVTDTKTQFDMYLWSTPSESYTGYKMIFTKYGIKETGHHEYTFEAQNASQQYWCIKHNGSTHDFAMYFKNSVTVAAGDTLTLSFDVVGYNPSVANGLSIKNFKLERGNKATDWTPAPEDVGASIAAAQSTANANVRRTQRIYYRKAAAGAPSVPTAWVTNGSVESSWTKYNAWSTRVPPIADSTTSTTKYLYLYTCEQYETAGGTTPQYTTVLLDDSTTIIDGGNIITGSIAANRLDVYDASINKIKAEAIDLTGVQPAGSYATTSALTTETNQRKAQYGTCSTAAGTAAKAVTCANFELVAGNELTVKFTTANTASAPTLNVNSKGAKNVWVGNAVTSATNQLLWGANAYITFRYDGTQFQVIGEPRTWYGACTTAEGTAAKTDTTAVTGCVVCKGAKVELAMTNANTAASPTLNVAGTGAKAVYFGNGTARPIKSGGTSWLAANTCTFTFDGAAWRTQGKTYIDANSIVTGYLSADRIEAGSITAGKLDADSVKADIVQATDLSAAQIKSGKISADYIDVSSISIGDLSGSIGGRNLLPETEKLSGFTTNNQTITIVDGVATLPGTSTAWDYLHTPNILFSAVDGNDITFSFEYKADKAVYGYIVTEGTANNDHSRSRYKDHTFNWPAKSEWTKWSVTFKGMSLAYLSQGSGDVNYFHLAMYDRTDSSNFKVRFPKLEKGNRATDWTPAPEDVNDRITYRGTCSTAAATAAKVVTCPDFSLATGATVQVYCSTANTAAAPTLNVNGTGSKAIWVNGAVTSATNPCKWLAGDTVTFTYDGTRFRASLPVENFITNGGSNGLMVHPSSDANTGVLITDKIDIKTASKVMNRIDTSGMTLYDGNGVADSNIVAKFASNLIELGKNSTDAVIKLCGGVSTLTSEMIDSFRHFVIESSNYITIRSVVTGATTHGFGVHIEAKSTSGDGAVRIWTPPNTSALRFDVEAKSFGLRATNTSNDITLFNISDLVTAFTAITTGTLAAARIPSLAASKITSGTFAAARIPAATASAAGAVTLPTALYSGTAKGNFTLTASAANYTRLRVFFTAANGGKGSVDVYSPDGSKFSCATTCLANSTTLQHEFAQWSISGTSVTWQNAGYVNLSVSTSLGGSVTKLTATTNQITITRVEGWTW